MSTIQPGSGPHTVGCAPFSEPQSTYFMDAIARYEHDKETGYSSLDPHTVESGSGRLGSILRDIMARRGAERGASIGASVASVDDGWFGDAEGNFAGAEGSGEIRGSGRASAQGSAVAHGAVDMQFDSPLRTAHSKARALLDDAQHTAARHADDHVVLGGADGGAGAASASVRSDD